MPNTRTIREPITPALVEKLKAILATKREETLDLYRHDVKVGQESTDDNADDFADRANNSYNRETMFALSDAERQVMFEIDEALQRCEAGTFGSCVECEEAIGRQRLEALPWARFCIDCQELYEKGLLDN